MNVEYDDLSDDVQHMLAKLKVEVADLQSESNFYRFGSLLAVLAFAERVWGWLF